MGPVIGGVLYQLGGFRLPFFSVGGFVLLSVILCFILVRSSGRFRNVAIKGVPLAI